MTKVHTGLAASALFFACGLALLSASCTPCYADDATELQRLADEAFEILHNVSVQLPDGTWERVARSTSPSGELQGLILKQYVDEFFLAQTLSNLDHGWIAIFRNEAEGFDVAIRFRRDTEGNIQVDFAFADALGVETVATAPYILGESDPCDGETTTCTGHSGSNPQNGYPNGLSN
ncbi:MAG: hypothetical protein D6725_16770 [Planctomycetota bacterium]|nr:MAG: hypothetical protein D6725_16770 [Planctomycetota bacterium]